MEVDGEPARPLLGLEHGMGDAGGQEEPVTGRERHPPTGQVEHGPPGEDDDPLVLGLDVGVGFAGAPAQDLLDDEVAPAQDLVEPLAVGGRFSRGTEPPPAPLRGDG